MWLRVFIDLRQDLKPLTAKDAKDTTGVAP